MDIKTIIGDYELFLDKIFLNIKGAGFDLADFSELDHIAFRTETIERYEEVKKDVIPFTDSWTESMFNTRLITILKMTEPFQGNGFIVPALELLAPKEGKPFKGGLEHAEFVINMSFDDFLKKYQKIKFNFAYFDREVNRELLLSFSDCGVKFHEQGVLEVRGM